MIREGFDTLLEATREEIERCYNDRLVSLAVFGSVARGTMRPDSDVDLLIVAEPLPDGRLARVDEFRYVEDALEPQLEEAKRAGIETRLAPLFKTPSEVRAGSPIFLDMTEEVRLVVDRGGFLAGYLSDLRSLLARRGARRIPCAGGTYWMLPPDAESKQRAGER